jgi:tRNA nucleotidyltransferase/poly(A) polymerase
MFEVLRECGALARILPEVDSLWGVPQRADYHPEVDTGVHVMMVLDHAAAHGYALPVRFAALTHDLGKATTPEDILPRHIGHEGRSVDLLKPLCERLRVPNECRDLALLVAREHGNIHRVMECRGVVRRWCVCLSVATRCASPRRFAEALQACVSDARGRLGLSQQPYPQAERFCVKRWWRRAQSMPAGSHSSTRTSRGRSRTRFTPRAWRRWMRCFIASCSFQCAAQANKAPARATTEPATTEWST